MKEFTYNVKLMDADGPKNSTVFTLGATGCGKTTLIANLLYERPRFVVFDTRQEYDPLFFGKDTPVVSTVGELVRELNKPTPKIVMRLDDPDTDEATLNDSLFKIIEFQRLNIKTLPPITVAMDELNRFVTSATSPRGLQEIIQRGRGHNIEKIFGAQWFNSIPTWARDTFTEVYAFKHCDPNGLRMLEVYGLPSEIVATLPPHTVVRTTPAGDAQFIKLTPS